MKIKDRYKNKIQNNFFVINSKYIYCLQTAKIISLTSWNS